jgi:hypothetical protein
MGSEARQIEALQDEQREDDRDGTCLLLVRLSMWSSKILSSLAWNSGAMWLDLFQKRIAVKVLV